VNIVVLIVVSFCAMEVVSYALHRWVMHGPGMRLHRSHHRPRGGRWEANDAFPALFSLVAIVIFLTASLDDDLAWLFWVGAGVTAYGLAYLVAHELYIHRRMKMPLPRSSYTDWLRASHQIHHLYGGEPFGMLFPIVRRSLRARAANDRETRARL